MAEQLSLPFLQHDDAADELASMIVAQIVNVVHQQAPPDFRWSPSAHGEICRARYRIAAMLRERIRAIQHE
jgi:hypothetical protein